MSGPHPDPLSDMLSKPHELDGRFKTMREAVAHGSKRFGETAKKWVFGTDFA